MYLADVDDGAPVDLVGSSPLVLLHTLLLLLRGLGVQAPPLLTPLVPPTINRSSLRTA